MKISGMLSTIFVCLLSVYSSTGVADFTNSKESGFVDRAWTGTCLNGKHQSPIDIRTLTLQETDKTVYLQNYLSHISATIINDGHTISFDVKPHNDIPQLLTNNKNYTLRNVHFHWGCTEHRFDNQSYAMEMHLVHFDEQTTKFTVDFSARVGISVVAVLFEISEKENERVNVLLDMISNNSTLRGMDKNSISYRDLLPEHFEIMYQYDGSLTTPPCFESVLWNIINEKSYVTKRQINELQRLLNKRNNSTKSGQHHCRQIQPLNDRSIYLIRQKHFEVGSTGIKVHSKFNIIIISFLLNLLIVNRYTNSIKFSKSRE